MSSCRPNNSIHIDKKVSVVSSSAKDLSKDKRKSKMYSKPSSGLPSHGFRVDVAPRLDEWKTKSGIAETSRSGSAIHDESRHQDGLEKNRESMKTLMEFLKTKVPPPNNFMSFPDSEQKSTKRSRLKMFGKQKQKKEITPKLLRLPDSAVSAKTTDGARHIAISIPIEYDHLEEKVSPLRQAPVQRHKRSSPATGGVVVLKPYISLPPVRETFDSRSQTFRADPQAKRDSRNTIPEAPPTPVKELLGTENAKTMEKYYSHMRLSDLKNSNIERSKPQRSYAVDSPYDTTKRNSQSSYDYRNSRGTAYSSASIYTHSRKRSSISIAPSITRLQSSSPDFPPRVSSITNIHFQPAHLFDTLLKTGNRGRFKDSIYSHKADSSVSSQSMTPIFYGTAEIAKSYTPILPSPAPIRNLQKPTLPSPAPTRNLPKLPGNRTRNRADSPCVPHFMPRPSPPPGSTRAITHLMCAVSGDKKRNETMVVTRQTRQERVKARKAKDIAALLENTKRIAHLGINEETSLGIRPNTATQPPIKTSRWRGASRPKQNSPAEISMSNIMIVAESQPFTGYVHVSDLALPRPKHKPAKNSIDSTSGTTITTLERFTPPQSLASAFGSDSESLSRITGQREGRFSGSSCLSKNGPDSRREDRRSRKSFSLREKDFDARLARIEKDNAILLKTLGGIAKSFAGLSMLLSQGNLGGSIIHEQRGLRERDLDPVMRELQNAAQRVSGEVSRKSTKIYSDEFDFENDGMWVK